MKKLFSNMKQRYSLRDYKFSLVVLVLAISVIGIFMVRSARPEYMTRQILGVVLGVAVMVVISLIDYNWVLNFYWLLYWNQSDSADRRPAGRNIFPWSNPLAGSWIRAVSAFGSCKNSDNFVLCKIFNGQGREY